VSTASAPARPTRPRTVRVRTPAKVNLVLGVGPRRDDGFHDLATVYYALDLHDELVADDPGDRSVTMTIEGSQPDLQRLPRDGRNLVVRAARLLARRFGTGDAGVRFALHKDIPLTAGLAGGSSDAAAALVACNALWGLGLGVADLLPLAAELGSDVPFCLLGGAVLGAGRGEIVVPVPVTGEQHWVLVLAAGGLSTPAMFAALDLARDRGTARPPTTAVPDELLAALTTGDAASIGAAMTNDLEEVAVAARPELARILTTARSAGAAAALVSGSGPTCAVLAHDRPGAEAIAVALRASGMGREVLITTGPARGARIV
jgi:4-diphosphocytidyl-2-C-methyl-D-erythritol kinase